MEDVKEYCKSWFINNNVSCPKKAREWKCVGKYIPPNTSLTALRARGMKPADIINYIYGENTAYTNSRHVIDYKALGLELMHTFVNDNVRTQIVYKCLSCGEEDTTDQGTIVRWKTRGDMYCSICRGVGGKPKPLEYYSRFVGETFKILSKPDTRHVLIECLLCFVQFTRSLTQLVNKETDDICCPKCSDTRLFIKGNPANGKYDSLIEKMLVEHLETFKEIEFNTQIPYSKILDTERKFVADIFIPRYNTIIEITSKSNNFTGYKERIIEKREMCAKNNIKFFLVTSKTEIEDIVQTILKDIEV